MKSAILFLLAFACGAAVAEPRLQPALGPDHVYVYGEVNKNYRCHAFLAYFDTVGNSVFYADNCFETSWDSTAWPPFPQQDVRLSLDFIGVTTSIMDTCSFVAHAQNADRSTSTVIDCRATAAGPVGK